MVNLDNVTTVPVGLLGRQVGFLWADQEAALSKAFVAAFDLEM